MEERNQTRGLPVRGAGDSLRLAMSDAPPPQLEACPDCAALLDMTDEPPLAEVHCPMCGTAVRAKRQFNNYQIIEALGEGGMGTVYRARDTNLNRPVALKLLRREFSENEEHLAGFEREAKITASITHPHVVKVFSFGSAHGIYYIAMELVDKGSLDDLMSLQKRVAELQALEVAIQVAEGLNAALQRGLIHRDVKPGNILFADARTAKITDFGLAMLMDQGTDSTGEVWGTPYYVAPEKLNKEPEDFRSDMYSLGSTMFHAIAGRPPFEAETASLVALKHLKSQVVSLQSFAPDVSSATAYVINRMCAKEPDQRYASYEETIEHLNYARAQLLENASKPRQPRQRVVVESSFQQALASWLTFGMLAVILIIGVLVFTYRERIFTPPTAPKTTTGQSQGSSSNSQVPPVVPELYKNARSNFIDGKYEQAEELFSSLARRGDILQPTLNWIQYQQGLSALMAGHDEASRAVFDEIVKAGNYSEEAAELPQAEFFVETARQMSTPEVIPADAGEALDEPNFEAMGLLAYGLKNWQLGDTETAAAHLRAFLALDPSGSFGWIAAHRQMAEDRLAVLQSYAGLLDILDAARTEKQKAAARKSADQFAGNPLAPAALKEKIAALAAGLDSRGSAAAATPQVTPTPMPEITPEPTPAGPTAEERAKEEESLRAAQAKYAALVPLYQFGAAKQAAEQVVVSIEDLVAQRDGLVKKAGWLADFKAALIADVNAAGYPGKVTKRQGGPIPGVARKASETQVAMVSPYGSIPVQWTELSPQMLWTMANYFTQRDPAGAAQRLWLTGVFAYEFGMKSQGVAALKKAAEAKAELQGELPLFAE